MTHKTFEDASVGNVRLTCNARGCSLHRAGVASYCSTHNARFRKHGSANAGRRIRSGEYKQESSEVLQVIAANIEHDGIKEGIARMQTWLDAAAMNDHRYPALADMNRLQGKGVTGRRVLEEAASIWLYARRNQRKIADGRQLNFALGVCVMFIVPLDYDIGPTGNRRATAKPTSMNRRLAGEFIRVQLGVLLETISRKVEELADAKLAQVKAMCQPLT